MQPRRECSRRGKLDRSHASRRFVWDVVGIEPQLPPFSPGGGIVGSIGGVFEKELREPSGRVALAKLWQRARWPPRRLLTSPPSRSRWHVLTSIVSPLQSPEVNLAAAGCQSCRRILDAFESDHGVSSFLGRDVRSQQRRS